ncbi:MAG TPA: glycerate kinase [Thermodesulfobacteriota bacterium]|nr:glycerate kinase [Thermodesulfobacteriota bacterium]
MNRERLRKDAVSIFEAGLKAVDPENAVKRHLMLKNGVLQVNGSRYALSRFENIYVIGMGKAAAPMARAVEDILGDRITAGIINVKYGHTAALKKVKINEAAHPLPDEAGLEGAREIAALLGITGERDLVVFLISGGGSALLPLPAEGLTLEDKQNLTQSLLECGATIHEINVLRKHVSRVKGGRLARLACPSTLISLILSDVSGDDLDSIASGPTVPDRSTFGDCLEIIGKYGLEGKLSAGLVNYIERGEKGEAEETPKPGDPAFERTENVIVGSNIAAARAAKERASELGYNSLILSTSIGGETAGAAKLHAAIAREVVSSGNPVDAPACIVSGGETTVTIRGKGKGGRNQEFALAAAVDIDGLENVLVMSGGTDGTDGPTDAAGAIADGTTIERARKLGLDTNRHLGENDSYNFFKPLGDLLMTGPTNTNVMDLRVVLVSKIR